MSAIVAAGLQKTDATGSDAVVAVRGVDIDVTDGQVFGFLGPNGAGKTTTVRMLTTLMKLTAGTAKVAGVDVASDPHAARRKIGVALQEAGLDSRQTGRELLTLDLATALVHRPEVLFLDEPTTGLDPVSRLTVWEELRRLNRRGTTVFLTTQCLEEADHYPHREPPRRHTESRGKQGARRWPR